VPSPDPQPSTEPDPEPSTTPPVTTPPVTTPPVTTPPVTSPPVGTQRITGLVWLDRDRDGVQGGAGEPGLPSVTVELYRVELAGSGAGSGRVGSVAPAAAAPVAQVQTAADGAFEFTALTAGAYAVRVRYPAALAVTWDSEGAFDATAQVLVPELGEAQAEVGLAGDAAADLDVRTPDGTPVDGTVLVWWAGPDGRFGTPDDVRVPATAVGGRVRVDGLPAGSYRVIGPDGSQVSSALALVAAVTTTTTVTLGPVDAAAPAATPVPAGAPAAAAAAAAGATPTSTPSRALAATGADGAALLATATWLVLGGLVLASAARRGRSRRSRA